MVRRYVFHAQECECPCCQLREEGVDVGDVFKRK
jgi:hypothetical protein